MQRFLFLCGVVGVLSWRERWGVKTQTLHTHTARRMMQPPRRAGSEKSRADLWLSGCTAQLD